MHCSRDAAEEIRVRQGKVCVLANLFHLHPRFCYAMRALHLIDVYLVSTLRKDIDLREHSPFVLDDHIRRNRVIVLFNPVNQGMQVFVVFGQFYVDNLYRLMWITRQKKYIKVAII